MRLWAVLLLSIALVLPNMGTAQETTAPKKATKPAPEKPTEPSPNKEEQKEKPKENEKISLPLVKLGGLDKITGRTYEFELGIDETVEFGALHIKPRVCYARPSTLKPRTSAFLEIDEITLEKKFRKAFSGWIFADSPGLSALEHPTYDVWLISCRGAVAEQVKENANENANQGEQKPNTKKKTKTR